MAIKAQKKGIIANILNSTETLLVKSLLIKSPRQDPSDFQLSIGKLITDKVTQ